jgi:hypothetical protein
MAKSKAPRGADLQKRMDTLSHLGDRALVALGRQFTAGGTQEELAPFLGCRPETISRAHSDGEAHRPLPDEAKQALLRFIVSEGKVKPVAALGPGRPPSRGNGNPGVPLTLAEQESFRALADRLGSQRVALTTAVQRYLRSPKLAASPVPRGLPQLKCRIEVEVMLALEERIALADRAAHLRAAVLALLAEEQPAVAA